MPSPEFREDINGLRAFAVAIVVLFHFHVPGFESGFAGVDVFFVISGFLMTKIIVEKLESGSFSVTGFYLARARRIVPALMALCAAMLACGWVSLDPPGYERLALQVAAAASFASNFLFWQQAGYFDVASHEKWLLHTWSLSVEWQFYLLLPLALLFVWKVSASRRALLIATTVAFVLSLALSIVLTAKRPDLAYYLLPTRAWQMLAGGLVFLAGPHFALTGEMSRRCELAGIGLILASATLLSPSSGWPGYLALVPVTGTALVMLARNTSSYLTANPVCGSLGRASYSIYLWHWPVVVALYHLQLLGHLLWNLAGIAISLAFGYLSYRFIERPTRATKATTAAIRAPAHTPLRMGMPAAAVIVAGLVVFELHGVPSRLGADQADYAALDAAIKDLGIPSASECDKGIEMMTCERKGTGSELMMFIGDSIVEEELYVRYGPAIATGPVNRVFLTHRGCLPLPGLDSCSTFADMAWAEVRRRKPQALVIASQWWLTFFYPDGGTRASTCLRQGDACEPIDSLAKLNAAFAPFERQLLEAVRAGTRIYLLGPMPISPVDYLQARRADLAIRRLPLPLVRQWSADFWEKDGIARLATTDTGIDLHAPSASFRFAANEKSPTRIVSAVLKAIAERTGATLVSPEEFLCPGGNCPLVEDGLPIYADAIHLRRSYIRSDAMRWLDGIIGIAPDTQTRWPTDQASGGPASVAALD